MNRLASLLRRSLPARLTAAFLALSLTTLVLASVVSYRSAEQALERRTFERLGAVADADADDISFWIGRQRAALEFLAQHPAVGAAALRAEGGSPLQTDSAFTRFLATIPGDVLASVETRLVGVPGGRVLASTDSTAVGAFALDERYYLLARDSTYTQKLYESSATGRPTLTVATPVRDPDGRTRAILAAHLDVADLEQVLMDEEGEVPIDVYLVDHFAQFVSAERYGRAGFRRGAHSEGIDRALARENGAAFYTDYAGQPVVGVYRWIEEQDLALLVEAPETAALAPARALLVRTLLVGLLASLLLTFGVVAITRRATRPILTVAEAAERVALGDFGHRAPEDSEDEAGRLAKSFNAMTRQLQTVYGELHSQVATTKQALLDAQNSRSIMQDLADNTTAVVIVIDLGEVVRFANAYVESLLGLRRGAAVGRLLSELLPEGAARALHDSRAEVLRRDEAVVREVTIATTGESHLWQATTFPLRDAQGASYAHGILAFDLTERARAEEERRQRDASVQQAQKLESLGIMAGGIAHDFNNILGAVLGNADIALASLDDPAEVRASLEQIALASRRAADLTRQMLAYAGRASLRREVTDIRRVLQDMLALVKAAQPKKVEFVVDPMDEPLWVDIDGSQLSQVALNLLTNAAEAIGDRVGTVRLTATRSGPPPRVPPGTPVPPAGAYIHISVEDDGEGMREEVRRRLFEPFFSTKRSGRGLGLSAVTGIIKSADGLLLLESEEGHGSRFDIYLPEAVPPSAPRRSGPRAAVAQRRGCVLIVDDEETLRRVGRRALEAQGLDVLEAGDGIEGLATFRANREALSLVILDMTMPGMGGAEVFARLREDHATLPVIVASGYAASDQAASLPPDPFVRYLQKPFGIRMLLHLVDELLP